VPVAAAGLTWSVTLHRSAVPVSGRVRKRGVKSARVHDMGSAIACCRTRAFERRRERDGVLDGAVTADAVDVSNETVDTVSICISVTSGFTG
jgi:hypothetical protein